MNIEQYLSIFKDIPFEKSQFNEVDALVFAAIAYPKYQDFIGDKKKLNAKEMIKALSEYDASNLIERKRRYIELLRSLCLSKRYKGVKFINFISHHDKDSSKQFQAISLIIKGNIYISFCGTDGTTIGWKEDLNMSFLEVTPSEVEALKYLRDVHNHHRTKKMIILGHSKGGRQAIYAAKNFKNKKAILGVYTFDSPNFVKEFYDNDYLKIENKIHSYLPEESIIGRLIATPTHYKIVKSNNSLIMQHDTISWEIKDTHFVYCYAFSKRSTRIVNTLNSTFEKYGPDTKKEFADTLFDLLERLSITEFSDKKNNLMLLKTASKSIVGEWKKTPKEDRKVLIDVLFSIVKDFIRGD